MYGLFDVDIFITGNILLLTYGQLMIMYSHQYLYILVTNGRILNSSSLSISWKMTGGTQGDRFIWEKLESGKQVRNR